ncbi:hypothetical protein MCHIJ_17060 [Mycolicibacterium chitae]|uniref:Filamentation induced by cAMP protein fic n=1 Tax=Mycolicibacterium chitae TaxID=1792 RepID=A0A448HWU4_MYCCI|nr:hypothetical protein [Mycolicibacterium chitae]BBZ02269.1 hypothetical protein MCHIJ_17060 [Mycolicibacterium chitae]VEG44521.1 filamentation induced by cAMP protein fic [Mycolicibacterium chitae]
MHWTRSRDGSYSRSSRRGGPYQVAIPPAIADVQVTLPTDVHAAAEGPRFDAELGGEIAPFSAQVLCSEWAGVFRS